MTTPVIVIDADEDDGHDCLDEVEVGVNGPRCGVCGEPVDIADATCNWCGRFPCYCDEAYERAKDERMGL